MKKLRSLTWMDLEAIDKYSTKCKSCKKTLDFDVTGMHEVLNGYMCDDCYYEEWGKLVEEHPIGIR